MRAALMIAIVAALVPDRPNPTPEVPRTPQELIIGDWLFMGSGKEPDAQPPAGKMVFRIMPEESLWIDGDRPSPGNGFSAKITFNWNTNPVELDMIPKHGGGAIKAIIRLDGDRLTLAWASTRPRDFSLANSVHHFTRIKQ